MSAGKVRRRRWVHEGVKREAWGFTLTTAEGRVRKSGYLTRGEAQEALDALKRPEPVVEPAAPVAPTLTFKAALDRYYLLKGRKKSIREDRRLGTVLLARFGDVPLSEITAAKISAYKAERLAVTSSRLKAPLSPASINRPLAFLRTVLRIASREWEVLPAVPHIKLEKERRGRERWLMSEEAVRLLDACRAKSPDLADMVEVAIYTGMRQGEILGLTWPMVDRSRGVVILPETKNGKSREVPLNGPADAVLARRQATAAGSLVFPSTRWDAYRRAWRKALQDAKLGGLKFHDLRHTFASWVMQAGGTLPELKDLLGHSSLTMVMRYAHLSPEHLRSAVSRLDGALPARAQETVENGTRTAEPVGAFQKS